MAVKPKPHSVQNTALLHDHIIDRICRLSDAMIRMSSRYMKQRWNLRHTDLRLLSVLDGEDSLSVNEISRRALVDQAWVSRSLKVIEERGLIKRRKDKKDSRLILISLTSKGRKLLEEFRPYGDWSQSFLLNSVNEKKIKQLLDQLEHNTEEMLNSVNFIPENFPRPD